MTLTAPPLAVQLTSSSLVSRRIDYARFFAINLSSAFFNRPDFEVCEFDIKPTAYTQKFLTNQSLTYRQEQAGISVGMAIEQRPGFIKMLKAGAKDESEWRAAHLQEWMSFTFTAVDTDFGNYTDLPPTFDVSDVCLYFANTQARRITVDEPNSANGCAQADVTPPDEAILSPADFVTIAQIVSKTGPICRYDFPKDCEKIEVLNIVDEVVLCYPRKVPLKLLDTAPPEYIDCALAKDFMAKHPGAEERQRDYCFVQFRDLRAGLYRVRYVGSKKEDEIKLYPGSATNCLGFVDIQLADPGLAVGGVFPINNLFGQGEPEFDFVDYIARFDVRKTHWEYVIVPRPGETLLAAEFHDPGGNPIAFGPGQPATVPQANNAVSFRSSDPFVFQNNPDFWLELSGSIEDADGLTSLNAVLVSALPTPAPTQIRKAREFDFKSLEGGHDEKAMRIFPTLDEMTSFAYVYL